MRRRLFALIAVPAALSSCSYQYELLALARDGRLAFIVDPTSDHRPSCLRDVEVIAEGHAKATPTTGDDTSRVGYGTFWFESVSYDDACANHFPLAYGRNLSGEHQQDRGIVRAKPLQHEVVYDVMTTTGATGYGAGRFVIHRDGRIENLPVQDAEQGLISPASNKS
jgi:hypothetical protein